jgi:hypothetical protein
MFKLPALNTLIGAALGVAFSLANAQAQEFVTWIAFQGVGFVTNNPTSLTCQANNINFGSDYVVVYRFSLNPSADPDALTFNTGRSTIRITSAQGPNFSLNGPATVNWDYINRYAFYGQLNSSSTNLTIASGLTSPVVSTTVNVRIVGTINDFFAHPGCTVNFHADLALIPN